MDTDADNTFYVHKGTNEFWKFKRGRNNLYYYDTKESSEKMLTITTLKGKMESYSAMDCKRAKRAAKLQEIVGYPSDKDFLWMIDNKVIRNYAITHRDIKMARDIFGKNKAIVQGKIVWQQTPHVWEDITMVP